jgi:tRNA-dihydrouridine synthase A
MREPELVGRAVAAMKRAVDIPVTVKCRLGVDDQDPETALDALTDAVVAAGTDAIVVHARKAWLDGLSPKQNRDVPPLDYDRVHQLKDRHPGVWIGLNGGLADLDEAVSHLGHLDGVMFGRAAYQSPWRLAAVDRLVFGETGGDIELAAAVEAYLPYVERQLSAGIPLVAMTRHMLGLFQGVPGARAWRRTLTVEAVRPETGVDVIERALSALEPEPTPLEPA